MLIIVISESVEVQSLTGVEVLQENDWNRTWATHFLFHCSLSSVGIRQLWYLWKLLPTRQHNGTPAGKQNKSHIIIVKHFAGTSANCSLQLQQLSHLDYL